jgi:hypothetical protein
MLPPSSTLMMEAAYTTESRHNQHIGNKEIGLTLIINQRENLEYGNKVISFVGKILGLIVSL